MKTYKVAMARIEHHIYRYEVQANSEDEAEEIVQEKWDEGDCPDKYEVVHAEEFINGVEEAK